MIPTHIQNFLSMEEGVRKNLEFKNLYPFSIDEEIITNEKVVLLSKSYKIKKGRYGNYYMSLLDKRGVVYNGKLYTYGNINILSICKSMNWNFIEGEIYTFITKSALLKLFQGKITNSKELLSHWCKTMRFKCSPSLLYDFIKRTNCHKHNFYQLAILAENIDNLCKRDSISQELLDLAEEFSILNKKINFLWSDKRIREEHKKATMELMEYEITDDEQSFKLDIELPEGFTQLNSKKAVYAEGKLMNHCIYTAYWHSISSGRYVAFHIEKDGEVATLGCNFNEKLTFNQLYGRHNKGVSIDLHNYVRFWIQTVNEQLTKSSQVKEVVFC